MDQYKDFIKNSITRAVLSTILTLVAIILAYNAYILYAYITLVVAVLIIGVLMVRKKPRVFYLGVLTIYSFLQILLAILLIIL